MKTRTFDRKLILNKKTVANLNRRQMNGFNGGIIAGGDEPAVNQAGDSTITIICPVQTGFQCLTDPPTLCIGCPQAM